MPTNSLSKLKDILENLPDGVYGNYSDDLMELNILGGVGYSIGILKNNNIAIAKTVVSKGGIFSPHYHKEFEIIIVYQCELKIWENANSLDDKKGSKEFTLKEKDIITIDPNTPHIAEAIVDTQFIAITIPSSKRFPNAKKT